MCFNTRAILQSLIAGLLIACFCLTAAAADRFTIINSSEAGAYRQAIDTLTEQFPANSYREYLLNKTSPQTLWTAFSESSRIVAVGSKACRFALQAEDQTPVLCGFITEKSLQSIRKKSDTSKPVTAVYIDQPLERLLDLAQLLRADQSPYRIGLLSNNNASDQHLIEEYSQRAPGVLLKSTELQVNDNPIEKIEPLISGTDVFVVRPSASHFNRLAAKLILQLSLRFKTPVIGFSQKYTKAGALISLFSSPQDIGLDMAEQLTQAPSLPANFTARHGNHFSLSVNQNVARKFQVAVNAEQLSLQLITMDKNRRQAKGSSAP